MPYEYAPAGLGEPNQNQGTQSGAAAETAPGGELQSFYARHQTAIRLIGGAALLGGGYWWWKNRREEMALVENEGHYNLPEPVTPKRPSGL